MQEGVVAPAKVDETRVGSEAGGPGRGVGSRPRHWLDGGLPPGPHLHRDFKCGPGSAVRIVTAPGWRSQPSSLEDVEYSHPSARPPEARGTAATAPTAHQNPALTGL